MAAFQDRIKLPGYVYAAYTIAIGGILNGFDTGSIGAISVMPQFRSTVGSFSPVLLGLMISMTLLGGAVPAFLAGQLADKWGRLPIIAVGAGFYAIGATVQAASYSLAQIIVGRAIAGIGEGLYLGTANVYVCEIAPSRSRGRLVSTTQLLVTVGICAGYFTCYGSVLIPSDMSWRTPLIIQAALAAFMTIACLRLPASPRWLVLMGRRDEALRAIERLGIERVEAEKDILRSPSGTEEELQSGIIRGLTVLFKKQYRSRTVLALFVLGMVQLCGIDGVLFYAPILFAQAGLTEETAGFLASGVSAILILAISIPAVMFADKWNRRTTIIAGGIGLSGSMFLIGSLYAANAVHKTGFGRWFVIVFIFIFALTYAATWAVVGKIYASEIQPAKTRAAANSLAQGLNFFTNALVALITPIFLAHSAYGAYFLFGGLSLATLLVLSVYMPETKGQPLESINEIFQRPHQFHRFTQVLRQRISRPPSTRDHASAEDISGGIELSEFSRMHGALGIAAAG